jgi:hypothetical protein
MDILLFGSVLVEGCSAEFSRLSLAQEEADDLVGLVVKDTGEPQHFHIDAGGIVDEAFNGSSVLQKLDKFAFFGIECCIIDLYRATVAAVGAIGAVEGLGSNVGRSGVGHFVNICFNLALLDGLNGKLKILATCRRSVV